MSFSGITGGVKELGSFRPLVFPSGLVADREGALLPVVELVVLELLVLFERKGFFLSDLQPRYFHR